MNTNIDYRDPLFLVFWYLFYFVLAISSFDMLIIVILDNDCFALTTSLSQETKS